MIELYESRSPSTGELVNGPYPLLDATDCIVTEERNGLFNLTMTYPVRAKYSDMLIPDAIVMATPRPSANPEPFRISTIEQVIEGVLTVRANHIAYDLDGTGVFQYVLNGKTFSTVVSRLNTWINAAGPTGLAGFEFVNDGITDNVTTMIVDDVFISFFQAIGMVASQFNAELKYVWDSANSKCIVYFCASRGVSKPTIISYGVNLISLDRTLSARQLYSDVRAYWTNDDGSTLVYSSYPTGYTKRKRTLWLNVTEQFPNQPNQTQLFYAAKSYVQSHDFSLSSELNVEFVPLEITTQYDITNIALVGTAIVGLSIIGDITQVIGNAVLYLCDTVTIDASLIGVTATAKCVSVVYNVITNKYDQVTVGTMQRDIVDTILNLEG